MSRWCQVVGLRFDWVPAPNRMVSGERGQIMFLPEQAIRLGGACGALKRIPKPDGYKVGKDGRVTRCSPT